MARVGEPGFVAQHIEKIVLGLCVGLFALALAWPLVHSFRNLNGTKPDRIDRKLLANAESLLAKNQAEEPPDFTPTDYAAELQAAKEVPFPVEVANIDITSPLPPIKMPEGLEESPPLAIDDLKSVPAPDKPKFWAGWELPNKGGQDTDDEVTVHVAAVYPWVKLDKQWRQTLKNPRIPMRIVVLGVRAEVQEMIREGVWTEPRPAKISTDSLLDSRGSPIIVPRIPHYDGSNGSEVFGVISDLQDDYWQGVILEPDYHEIYLPAIKDWGSWQVHLPKTEVSEISPTETAQPTTPTRAPRPTRADRYRRDDEGRRRDDEGRRYRQEPDYREAVRTEQTRRTATGSGAASEHIVTVPDLVSQRKAGKLLVWFHDNSLEPMKVYRYRVQLVLLNPLYTYDREVKDAQKDSREVSILTPFSEWSDMVFVPTTTEFLVVGGGMNTVTIRVFAQRLGQRIGRSFTISQGQQIGNRRDHKVINPSTGQQELRQVPFDTGAVAVDFDFDKQIPIGGRNVRSTIELVYLDKDGQLKSSIQNLDENSERSKELIEETKQAAPPPPPPKPQQTRETTRTRRPSRPGLRESYRRDDEGRRGRRSDEREGRRRRD